MLPLTQKSMKINEHDTFACAWLDCECPAEIWPTDNSQERPWSFRSLEALQEMNSTRHHQQCLQALTKAVLWYSLYCNSMFTDLRHRPRPNTKLEKRKAHGAIKRLSPETMQKIANGYLFLDWFAIPQNLGIFFLQLFDISTTEWWAMAGGMGFLSAFWTQAGGDWGDFLTDHWYWSLFLRVGLEQLSLFPPRELNLKEPLFSPQRPQLLVAGYHHFPVPTTSVSRLFLLFTFEFHG